MLTTPTKQTITTPQPQRANNIQPHTNPWLPGIPPCPTLTRLAFPQGGAQQC